MKYNDNTVFANVINISEIFHLSFTSIIYMQDLKSLKSINPFCADVNLSEHWLMRGRSHSPEQSKRDDAFFLNFFDTATLSLGSKSKIMI